MLPPPAEKLQNFFGVFLQFQIGVDKTCVAVFVVALVFSVAITLIFVKGFSLTLPMGVLG